MKECKALINKLSGWGALCPNFQFSFAGVSMFAYLLKAFELPLDRSFSPRSFLIGSKMADMTCDSEKLVGL